MKKFRSALSLLIALAMVFSCFTAFAADGDETGTDESEREIVTSFSDVDPNSVTGSAIISLALLGVVNGRPDGTFGPDENITRAEFSAIIVRLGSMADIIADDAVTGFADLDADDTYKWARPYIKIAKDAGYMDGVGNNNFAPGDPVTYEQVVAVLMRMHGWGTVCDQEAAANPAAGWSAPYLKYAKNENLTKNASDGLTKANQATTRGVVAILANNSRSLANMQPVIDPSTGGLTWRPDNYFGTGGFGGFGDFGGFGGGSGSGSGGNGSSDDSDEIISGIVTATYLAYLEEPKYELGKNEIMVGTKVYTLSRKAADSVDLYELLGQSVKMKPEDGDDEYIESLSTTDYSSTDIYSGCVGGNSKFLLDINGGKIEYVSNPETFKTSSVSARGDVIYNGKLMQDFNLEDLVDPSSPYYLESGLIEVAENGRYNFVKISNYKTYVVNGTTTRNNVDYITLKYKYDEDENVNGDNRILIPSSGDADYFVFRRGSTDLSEKDNVKSDIKLYDVVNILRSPEDADGPSILKVEISRNSQTKAKVNSVSSEDDNLFEIGGKYLQYNKAYSRIVASGDEEVPELRRGMDNVNVYLDYVGQIAAVTTSASGNTEGSFVYGYLADVIQGESGARDLQLYIIDINGNDNEMAASDKVYIDGKRYNDDDEEILDLLRASADLANESYLNTSAGDNLSGYTYAQPIRYKINTSTKLVTAIDTLAESDIDGNDLVLSARIDDSTTDDGLRTYNRSSGFPYIDENGDEQHFSLTSAKILFVPDNRIQGDKYEKRTSSSFTAGNKYYVEAFNVGKSGKNRADLVLLYSVDDSMIYNYKSPFMIVTDTGMNEKDEEYIVGYVGNKDGGGSMATSTTTIYLDYSKLDSDARRVYNDLSKGDIVRYLLSSGKISDMELWLDASNPVQDEPAVDQDEAVRDRNRILAIRSNSPTPVETDAYNAAFRLAYGTVLRHETDIDVVTVSPTLVDDDVEMADSGTGVVAHLYNSNTKVFVYNGKSGVEYIDETDAMDDLQAYEDGTDGSVVVTYTTGDSTNSATYFKMIYIIK